MTTVVKSTSITNLDAQPIVMPTAGEGGVGRSKNVNDFATTIAQNAPGEVVRLCRIPSNAKVKSITVEGAAMTKGSFDIGLYWSDSTTDGTPVANQGNVISGAQAFFTAAKSFASAVTRVDATNGNAKYPVSSRNVAIVTATNTAQIGTVLGTSQVGGMVDVCLTSTNTVLVGGLVAVEVHYIE